MFTSFKNIITATLALLYYFNSYGQDSSGGNKNAGTYIVPFILADTPQREFSIDITEYVVSCRPGTFDSYIKKGSINLESSRPFEGISIKRTLLHPVNEIDIIFRIQNPSSRQKTVYLECGLPDLLKLVCLDDPEKKIYAGGFLGRSNRVSVFSPDKFMPLRLPPGSISTFLVYAKFMGSYKEKITPRLLSEKTYHARSITDIDKNRVQLIYHSFIIGGIFIISLFMFAQFFLNKDKAYLFYAAYGLMVALLSEKIMELNCRINLISYFIPYYVFYSHVILQLLGSFFYIGFLKHLLEISRQNRAIFIYIKIARLLILLGCILYCVALFIDNTSTFTAIVYNYGAFVSTIIMVPLLFLLFLFKKKDLSVKFLIAGFSIVVIGTLSVVYINRSGFYKVFTLLAPVSIVEFAIFVEMICFGLALGYKTYKQKLEKENIVLQKTEMEMAALKAQMNPHFMFNCINSIDAFIHSNDKYNATLYLNKFAKLLRGILESSKQNTVPFSNDVETLRLYIELEELRHENKFTTRINIDPRLPENDYKVPPLIVQPFVENAILHGLKNREDEAGVLDISITKNDNGIQYCITDNGIGRDAAGQVMQNKESHYGMQMSCDRIKLFNKEQTASVQVDDLYENGKAAGTRVTFTINIV